MPQLGTAGIPIKSFPEEAPFIERLELVNK